MRDWSSLLHIQKAQALTVIFWISCKYTVPWRWQCKASAGNCSPWCFFVMEVQVIKFEISLMRSKVSVFFLCLSSLSLKFKVLFCLPPKRGDILCSWYYFFHHACHFMCAFGRISLFAVPCAYLVLQQLFVSPACSCSHRLPLWWVDCSHTCHCSVIKCSYAALVKLFYYTYIQIQG